MPTIVANDLSLNVTSKPGELLVRITSVSGDLVQTPLADADYGFLQLTDANGTLIKKVDFDTSEDVSGNTVKSKFSGLAFAQHILTTQVTDKSTGDAEDDLRFVWPDPENVPAPQIGSSNIVIDNTTSNGKATITFNKVANMGTNNGSPVVEISGYRFEVMDGSNDRLTFYATQPSETDGDLVTVVINGQAVGNATTTSNPVEQNLPTKILVRTQFQNKLGGDKLETGSSGVFNVLLGDAVDAAKGTPEHENRVGYPGQALLNITNIMDNLPGGAKPAFTIGSFQRRLLSTANYVDAAIPTLDWATNNISAQLAVTAAGIPGTDVNKLYSYRLKASYAGKTMDDWLVYDDISASNAPANVTLLSANQTTAKYYAKLDEDIDNAQLGSNSSADYSNMWFRGPGTIAPQTDLTSTIKFKLASQADICASGISDFSVNIVFLGVCGETSDYDTVLETKSFGNFTDACGNEVYSYTVDTNDMSGVSVSNELLNGLVDNGATTFKYRLDVSNAVQKISQLSEIQQLVSLPNAATIADVKSLSEDDPADAATNRLGAKIEVQFDICGNQGGNVKTNKFPGYPGATGNNIVKSFVRVAPTDASKNTVSLSTLNGDYLTYASNNNIAPTEAGQAAWVAKELAYNQAVNAGVTKEITNPLIYDPLDESSSRNKVVIDGLAYGESYSVSVYNETSKKLRSDAVEQLNFVPGGEYNVPEPTMFFIDVSGNGGDNYDVSLSIPVPNQKLYQNTLGNVAWTVYNYDASLPNNKGSTFRSAQNTTAVDTNDDTINDQWQIRFDELDKGTKYVLGGRVNATNTEGAVLSVNEVYYDLILTTAPDINSFSFDGQFLTVNVDPKGAEFKAPSWLISNADFHDAAGQNAHAIDITALLNDTPANADGTITLSQRIYNTDKTSLQELVVIVSNAMGTDVSGSAQLDSNKIEIN